MTPPPKDREREALIAALIEQARSDAGASGPQPEPEELLDFLNGRLDPEEEERLSRHLVSDPDASRALLDLADLEAAGKEAGERPAELAAVAGWRDFERRLPEAAPSRFRRFQTLLPSIAAALLVATVSLGTWGLRLQGELNRPVANLRSQALALTRAGLEPEIVLESGAPLRLVLHPERCPVYQAEVGGPARRDLVEGLTLDPLGNINVLLPRAAPGPYNLQLYGCTPRRELGTYRFRITPDGD